MEQSTAARTRTRRLTGDVGVLSSALTASPNALPTDFFLNIPSFHILFDVCRDTLLRKFPLHCLTFLKVKAKAFFVSYSPDIQDTAMHEEGSVGLLTDTLRGRQLSADIRRSEQIR